MAKAILFSGGLDSTCAAILMPDAHLIRVSVGSAYDDVEALHAEGVAKALHRDLHKVDGVINLSRFEEQDALIPARNAIITLTAAQYFNDLVLVSVDGDGTHATDKDQEFADLMSQLMTKLFGKECSLTVPFRPFSKMFLAKRAVMHDWRAVAEALRYVYSCYNGGTVHCGQCKACIRLFAALHCIDPNNMFVWPLFDHNPKDLPWPEIVRTYKGRGEEEKIATAIYVNLCCKK